LTQLEFQLAETTVPAFTPLLSDSDVANILVVTIAWVRSHAAEIPGFKRLGSWREPAAKAGCKANRAPFSAGYSADYRGGERAHKVDDHVDCFRVYAAG
jgi:hypothetical protein